MRTSPWKWVVAATLLLVVLLSLRLIQDYDIGFHLRGGQWMLEHRAFHDRDVFTYTVNDHDYVALHWLYQVVLYLCYDSAGYAGISLLNTLFVLAAFVLLCWRTAGAGAPPPLTAALLLLCALGLEPRMQPRPEILSWSLLSLTLILLDRRVAGRWSPLWLLPVIQVLWVNLHGFFVFGWVATLAYIAGSWAERRRPDWTLIGAGLGSFLAALLNPWGAKGVLLPLTLVTRLQESSVFKQVLLELRSPWDDVPGVHLFYLVAGLTILVVLSTLRKRPLHELLLIAAFLALALRAIRNVPFFYLVALPVLAGGLHDLTLRAAWLARLTRLLDRRRVAAVATAGVLLFACRIPTNAHYASQRISRQFGIGIDPHGHAVGADEFLRARRLTGRLFNHFNLGSWLIWTTRQPVYIDGRLEVIGEPLFREYLTSYDVSGRGLLHLADRYQAQLILYDPDTAKPWTRQLQDSPWRLLYWESNAVIWARAGYAPEVPTLDFASAVEAKGIPLATEADARALLRRPLARPWKTFVEGFYERQVYPAHVSSMAIFAYENGQFEAAQALFLEAIRRSERRYPEFYFNLGSLYFRNERFELARVCYEKALQADPDNRLARERLALMAAGRAARP